MSMILHPSGVPATSRCCPRTERAFPSAFWRRPPVAGTPEGCNIIDMSEPGEPGSLTPLLHFAERDRGGVYWIGISRDQQVVIVAPVAEDLVGSHKCLDALVRQ